MTLSNILVSIFILALVTSIVLGVYLTYTNIFQIQIAYGKLTTSSTIAIQFTAQDIMSATRIVPTATINSTLYTTDQDTLVLELPSVDSSQNILSGTYDYIAYYRDPSDGTLLRSDMEADTSSTRVSQNRLISKYISDLSFSYDDINLVAADKVEMVIKVSLSEGSSNQVITIQSTSHLRNNDL